VATQVRLGAERRRFVAEEQWQNRRRRDSGREAESLQSRTQIGGGCEEARPRRRQLRYPSPRRPCRRNHRRSERRRRNKSATALDEIRPNTLGAGDVAARAAECLTEGAHENEKGVVVAQLRRPRFVDHAVSTSPQETDGVRFIDEEQRLVPVCEPSQSVEIAAVALHAEERLADDDPWPVLG